MTIAATRLRIDGLNIDRVLKKISLHALDVHVLGSIPQFSFSRYGQAPELLPDPYLGKDVEVWVSRDGIAAEVLRFKGDIVSLNAAKSRDSNYTFDYTCEGLRCRGERFPVRDDYTGTSTIVFNLPGSDPAVVPSKSGRTIGQVLISALEMRTNSANLASAGIGLYKPGSGAAATIQVSGGKLVPGSVVITNGGGGYDPGNPPTIYFLGSHWTVQGTGTAVITSGSLSGITVTNVGSGYAAAPEVVVSRLPTATLADLEALDRIPPMRCDISGEKLIQALETLLKAHYPNHYLNVEPTGAIRVYDVRTFTPVTLTMGVDPIEPFTPHRDTTNSYPRVEVRGRPMIEACEFALTRGTFAEKFEHDGLSNADAKLAWRYSDFNALGTISGAATAHATLAHAGVDTITVTNGGTGFTGTPTISFTGGGGSGAVATATVSGGVITAINVTTHGSGYSVPPRVNIVGGGGTGVTAVAVLQPAAVASLTLDSPGYGYTFTPDVVITGGGGTGATAHVTMNAGSPTSVATIVLDSGGSGYISPPTVHISGPFGPSADFGTCVVGDPSYDTLHVVIRSDDPSMTWPLNFQDQTDSGRHAVIMLSSSIAPGIDSIVTRRALANTALPRGGTCIVTVDLALPHTNFDSYSLHGTTGGGSIVWRKYAPTDAVLAGAMTLEPFTYPFPYHAADGQAVTLTCGPTSAIVSGVQQAPLGFIVDPVAGVVLFDRPVVSIYGTQANLEAGGASTDGIPDDVRVLVGCYKSNLVAVCPDDAYGGVPQYDGTIFTVEGIERTLAIQVDEWQDPAQQAAMHEFACDMLDSVKDTVVEGQINYLGFLESLLEIGSAYNITSRLGATVIPTGWEDINLPALGVTLQWHPEGSAMYHSIAIRASNRRAAYTAAPFLVPSRTGLSFGGDFGALMGPVGIDASGPGAPMAGMPGVAGVPTTLDTPQTGVGAMSADNPAYQAGVANAQAGGGTGSVAGSEFAGMGGGGGGMGDFGMQAFAMPGMGGGGTAPSKGSFVAKNDPSFREAPAPADPEAVPQAPPPPDRPHGRPAGAPPVRTRGETANDPTPDTDKGFDADLDRMKDAGKRDDWEGDGWGKQGDPFPDDPFRTFD